MQIDNIDIPNEWITLLTDLQKIDPTAVIAGGAIRDLFLGKFPKDLDFFTVGPMPAWPCVIESSMDYEGMQYVQAVNAYTYSPPINVIIIEHNISVLALIESFDFGICQIAFDGQKIIKSSAFDWDYKHGLMSMRHTDRYQRSIKRYNRIGKRLGLELSIPTLETKKVI